MTDPAQLGRTRPVALVTGGAKRVGRSICRAFAAAGYDVALTYNTSRRDADETVQALRAMGVNAAAFSLTLDDLGACDEQSRAIAIALPRVRTLVLNASSYKPGAIADVTAERLLSDFAVNAASGALVVKNLLQSLRAAANAAEPSAIVTMCDIHALGDHGTPRRGFVSYAMSKAALLELTMTLARELAPTIRVNAVAPGVVAFPETGHESDEASQRAYLARVPMARTGTPEEAAAAVLWLAKDATYTTGQVVRVDGGRWIG